MSKEKFQVPLPSEEIMQQQIQKIVKEGVKTKESFLTFIKSMYKQIGLRHLFSNRAGYVFTLFTVIILLSTYMFSANKAIYKVGDLYAYIFLFSPIVFLVFSLYTYMTKVMNTTFEVEMTCKYHVFQIIAFRMLTFSVLSIFINTIAILLMAMFYEQIDFIRAFMISTTGLFLFSILFLYSFMRRHSFLPMISTVVVWFIGNLVFNAINKELYTGVLIQLPLFVYGFVFICTAFLYVRFLNRLIHYKQKEGAY